MQGKDSETFKATGSRRSFLKEDALYSRDLRLLLNKNKALYFI